MVEVDRSRPYLNLKTTGLGLQGNNENKCEMEVRKPGQRAWEVTSMRETAG